jgi:dipeptidyl aminopeptidase/acylaminoacyl peptidase
MAHRSRFGMVERYHPAQGCAALHSPSFAVTELFMPKSACRPDVVRRQVAIEGFTLSPDGQTCVFLRRHVEGLAYRTHLWRVPNAGGHPEQLTRGALRDSSPSISPDGSLLAFVRTESGDDHGQVWLLRLDGRGTPRPRRLARLPHGASSVSWSPAGHLLAVLGPSDDTPLVVGRLEEGKAPLARRITTVDWRDDDVGHRDRRNHLFLLEPRAGAKPVQLTRGDYDVHNPAWSHDGSTIAFATDRRPERDLYPRSSIWVIDVGGGEPREMAALAGDADNPAWSPDGRWLAFAGQDVDDPPEYEPWLPWIVPAQGGPARRLIPGRDLSIGVRAWSDLDVSQEKSGPIWLDGDSLGCLIAPRSRCLPFRLSLTGGAPEPLVTDEDLMASALQSAGGRLVISGTLGGRAAELYALEDGMLRRLTRNGSAWQARYALPAAQELNVPGPAGPIHAWLFSPPGAGGEALPLVFQFHGGPTGAYGPAGSLDAMILTSAGYRVAMPNIRGSAGFGYEWTDQLRGRWGEVDREDVLAVADWLVDQGLADPARLGMFGYSYAGYLVQWLVATTDRFAAAVAENGVGNQVSSWGNCYFGVHWNRRLQLGSPLDEASMLHAWRHSPLSQVSNIRTPLLILQAEEDRNCPAADSEQLFTALRALGRDVEYVLYPEEHHEMKSYGRPDRRIDRHQRILDWFARHLRV